MLFLYSYPLNSTLRAALVAIDFFGIEFFCISTSSNLKSRCGSVAAKKWEEEEQLEINSVEVKTIQFTSVVGLFDSNGR